MAGELTVRLAVIRAVRVALLGDPSSGGRNILEGCAWEQAQDGMGVGVGVLPPLVGPGRFVNEALAAPVPSSQSLQHGGGLGLGGTPASAIGHRGSTFGIGLGPRRPGGSVAQIDDVARRIAGRPVRRLSRAP